MLKENAEEIREEIDSRHTHTSAISQFALSPRLLVRSVVVRDTICTTFLAVLSVCNGHVLVLSKK